MRSRISSSVSSSIGGKSAVTRRPAGRVFGTALPAAEQI